MELTPAEGFLVLADISGFTAFVTSTELQHGAELTGILLETVMHRLSPPLEIQELEGDAVFAIGLERGGSAGGGLVALLAGAFAAFKEEQRRLADDKSCACGACTTVLDLDLKLIAHHGRFVRQSVGGRLRAAGRDVVLVHRLLKNPIGGDAYLLFTEPALERAGVDPIACGMQRHLLRYPHFGEVPCFIVDLHSPRTPAFASPLVMSGGNGSQRHAS